jgi:hypothetical protein
MARGRKRSTIPFHFLFLLSTAKAPVLWYGMAPPELQVLKLCPNDFLPTALLQLSGSPLLDLCRT